MKEQEKILTLHPQGKKGVNISKKKYDQIASFKFDRKVVWYLVSVKLDLEARHLIERIPKKNPQRLRMVKS